jgi:hypothetical protein
MLSLVKKQGLPVILCMALLITMIPTGIASAAGLTLTSLNVGGTAVNDLAQTAGGLKTVKWSYDPDYDASGTPVLSLAGYGNGTQNITAEGDLVIAAHDFNHIKKINVTNTDGKLIIIGSGVIVVEEITNWNYVAANGAAVFVNVIMVIFLS